MSYASAAKQNRLPEELQPKPDPNLLEGSHGSDSDNDLSHSGASDDKVHIVTREEFELDTHPVTEESHGPVFTAEDAAPPARETAKKAQADVQKVEKKAKETKDSVEKSAKETANTVEKNAKETATTVEKNVKESADAAEKKTKEVANATEKEVKKDVNKAKEGIEEAADVAGKKLDKASQVAKEEYDDLSEKAQSAYNKMSKEAREDWHKLSKESKKRWQEAKNSEVGKELQKPEVWGSMLGVTNLAVLGGVAFFAYSNWNRPRWDRRVVSATVIGLGTWFGLQGWLIPQTDAVKQRRA